MSNLSAKEFETALMEKARELAVTRPSKEEITILPASELVEDIQQINNREIALELMSRNWVTATEVDAALKRVSQGTFGLCQSCDKPISPRRLQAIPWAKHCVNCQQAIEESRGKEPLAA